MEKIRYGIIGIKGIGKVHLRLAQQNERVELAALADVDAAAVRSKSEELGVRGFTDYRDMLEAGVVDAVSVAVPHHLHAPISLDCLKAGVHVFVEKPIAICVSDADEMIRVARASGLKLCVGHQYRTHRSSRTMKHLIDTGAVGNILRVLWSWGQFRPDSYYARELWRRTWRHAGGGILSTHVSHDLDLMCWMVGRPVQVAALMGRQLHTTEVEDIAGATILFENGALASFQATINQPQGYSVRQIMGERGVIVVQDVKSLNWDRRDEILLGTYEEALTAAAQTYQGHFEQPATAWRPVKLIGDTPAWERTARRLLRKPEKRPHGLQALMDSFVDAILTGGEPLVNGESARQTLELINAIVLSAMRKEIVDLPLDPAAYDALHAQLCTGDLQVPSFHPGERSLIAGTVPA